MRIKIRNPKSEGRTSSWSGQAEGRNSNAPRATHLTRRGQPEADHVSRFTFRPLVAPKSDEGGSRITHHASRITSQSAIALVITLILLAVITFMAITFLVLSTRHPGS